MKETDRIISGNLEGSAWSQLGGEGLGSDWGAGRGSSGDDNWRSSGGSRANQGRLRGEGTESVGLDRRAEMTDGGCQAEGWREAW